ncbi:hypothetical protein HYFRA_00008091 [Hymenoscyphus fraxineus]|uniref:Uncharacterized protein n=1 Tax=Hymenoscyphus fraxineus TaxID=746836 RepID=A0A9N9KQ58_9HELO|nr:hypothetical protein HYFRA_00008091 [Hymenoscyphus fraxineus]
MRSASHFPRELLGHDDPEQANRTQSEWRIWGWVSYGKVSGADSSTLMGSKMTLTDVKHEPFTLTEKHDYDEKSLICLCTRLDSTSSHTFGGLHWKTQSV